MNLIATFLHRFGRFNPVIVAQFGLIISINLIAEVRLGVFKADVSPPIGSPLAYNQCQAIGMPLSARGVVLNGAGAPIVLCAVDWIGISNDGHAFWRKSIADAVGTEMERVTVHTLHQHDAPRCDFSVERLMKPLGLDGVMFDPEFARRAVARVSKAAAQAMQNATQVSHYGLGQAMVERVASNRRILGANGKVRATRYTACKDPALRAEPEGQIDPFLKSVSFWNGDELLTVLTFYATHPQSYYLTGRAHPDFPGMARQLRESTLNGVPHIHFNGAGGDIGAGKYNDGAPENRQALAVRLANAMSKALKVTSKYPLTADTVGWETLPVALPPAPHLKEQQLLARLEDPAEEVTALTYVAKDLAWLRRCQNGETIDLHCLRLGDARMLYMPGELTIPYQLAAQSMLPRQFVAMAAYGDYAPGYICAKSQYGQGGYEDSPRASKVAPNVEGILLPAIQKLLLRD
jgi:hypothetical protein